MLNQFTGIGKVINKEVYFEPVCGYDVIKLKLQLCSKETKEEYIFEGTSFYAIYDDENRKKFDKFDKINIDDIVSFKGHFTTYSTMVMNIDSLMVV